MTQLTFRTKKSNPGEEETPYLKTISVWGPTSLDAYLVTKCGGGEHKKRAKTSALSTSLTVYINETSSTPRNLNGRHWWTQQSRLAALRNKKQPLIYLRFFLTE